MFSIKYFYAQYRIGYQIFLLGWGLLGRREQISNITNVLKCLFIILLYIRSFSPVLLYSLYSHCNFPRVQNIFQCSRCVYYNVQSFYLLCFLYQANNLFNVCFHLAGKFHCHARVTSIIGHGRDQYSGKTFSPDIADILISHGWTSPVSPPVLDRKEFPSVLYNRGYRFSRTRFITVG